MRLSLHDEFIEFWGGLKIAHALQVVQHIYFDHVVAVVLFVGCGGDRDPESQTYCRLPASDMGQ